MFNSRAEALKALGMQPYASDNEYKTAYRNITKKCHPDNTSDERLVNYFYVARDAYDYLESHPAMTIDYNNIQKVSNKPTSRIIGQANAYSYNHNDYKNRRKKEVEKRNADRIKAKEELELKAKELREAERMNKEKELLDTIRWIRIADIIHKAIQEDKKNAVKEV